MIEKGTEVEIAKIGIADDPKSKTPSWDNFHEGKDNPGKSIPEDYKAEGELFGEISEDIPLVIERTKRNDTERLGFFKTSPVQSVDRGEDEVIVKTMNSVYRVRRKP